MAVVAGHYVRRGRGQDVRAAKERRQKQILVGGVALLGVVLGLQLPRILHGAHGESPVAAPAGAPAQAPAQTGARTAPTGPTRAELARRLAFVRKLDAKDPFSKQEADAGASGTQLTRAGGPSVRPSHFVAKDPFAHGSDSGATGGGPAPAAGPSVRATLFVSKDPFAAQPAENASATTPPPAAGRRRGAGSAHGYVVVLASIPVPDGYAVAVRTARFARARGIDGAAVLSSSAYGTLRSGFYVVYSSTYRTMNAALRGLTVARAHGFPTAYTRPLGR